MAEIVLIQETLGAPEDYQFILSGDWNSVASNIAEDIGVSGETIKDIVQFDYIFKVNGVQVGDSWNLQDNSPSGYILYSQNLATMFLGIDSVLNAADLTNFSQGDVISITKESSDKEISKVKLGDTTYNIKDTTAREGLLTKQDTLTAGDYIIIDANNEISVDMTPITNAFIDSLFD